MILSLGRVQPEVLLEVWWRSFSFSYTETLRDCRSLITSSLVHAKIRNGRLEILGLETYNADSLSLFDMHKCQTELAAIQPLLYLDDPLYIFRFTLWLPSSSCDGTVDINALET